MSLLRIFLASVFMIGVGIGDEVQAKKPKPYKSKTLGVFTPIAENGFVVTFSGVQNGQCTHGGKTRIESLHTFNFASNFGSGTYTQRTANGSTIKGEFSFSVNATQTGIIGRYKILGGTGLFEGATGEGALVGIGRDPLGLMIDLVSTGTINY